MECPYAPLLRLNDSAQAADIAKSKAPSDLWPAGPNSYARTKGYIKESEMGYDTHPRNLAFPQPYWVASERSGLGWSECNRVYLGALAGCNLQCPYCYLDWTKADDQVRISSEQYVQDFLDYNECHEPAGVLRISGGEPLLFQDWVEDVVSRAVANPRVPYIWMDSNATLVPNQQLLSVLRPAAARNKVGICLCFKPGVEGTCLDDQLQVVREFVGQGLEVFFYYPSWGLGHEEMVWCLCELAAISEFAPLRTTVIEIKWNYEAMVDRRNLVSEQEAHYAFRDRRETLRQFCQSRYNPSMLWVPSHHVPLVPWGQRPGSRKYMV